MTFGKGHHLHLIDGSAYIFRAYHALPPLTRKSDGLPVGAVAGFCNILWNELSRATSNGKAATHLAVIFDHSATTFRNALYPEYKANRPDLPEDLRPQFPLTREATRAFNVACLETEGYEADDIIAALSCRAVEAGGSCTIISSDKDLMQLVGNGVDMLDPMKNKMIGPDEVFEKFGHDDQHPIFTLVSLVAERIREYEDRQHPWPDSATPAGRMISSDETGSAGCRLRSST